MGRDGVWQNERSPAVYWNLDRYGQTPVPADADADAEPDWRRRSDEPTVAWHDHRIHWMSPERPPQVTDSGSTMLLFDWEVPVLVDGEPASVTGELWWIPPASPWPWLAAGVALSLPAVLGFLRLRRGDAALPRLLRPAAGVLGVVAVASLARLADHVTVSGSALEAVPEVASTLLVSGVGVYAAIRAWRGTDTGAVTLAVGALVVAAGHGLLSWSVLSAPQLSGVLPDAAQRLLVAASLGQGPLVAAVAIVAARRHTGPAVLTTESPAH